MKIFYTSDLHNDCHEFKNDLVFYGSHPDDILVVAGDVNTKGRSIADIEAVSKLWKYIIYVPGNHDWWGLSMTLDTHKQYSDKENVITLINESVVLDDILFVGTTLWAKILNPLHAYQFALMMNDNKRIRTRGYHRFTGVDCGCEYKKATDYIQQAITKYPNVKTKILVTHHAISRKSLNPIYAGELSNDFYASGDDYLLDGFDYHIHGHIHMVNDYMLNNTRVLANPNGYSRSEVPDYDRSRYIDV